MSNRLAAEHTGVVQIPARLGEESNSASMPARVESFAVSKL